jgi:nucleotide-binding universal stress UspA family protein
MKVLVATDGSVHASAAMLAASRFLRLADSEVDVVSVAPEPPAGLPEHSGRRVFRNRLAESAKRTVQDAQRILSQAHVKTRGLVETGSPADRLLALTPGYDLTVVGAYGGHDRKQPGLGPVSSQLLQASRGNVLVGREVVNDDNYRVLVALDSSEASRAALRALGTLFDPSSFEVTVMHVIELPWTNIDSGQPAGEGVDVDELSEYQNQLERELRRNGNSVVQSALTQLERWSVPATPIIAEGDPVLELCSEAEEGGYDLVIAGATGASDVKHALLGSVSLKLAWDAPCSVAIIRQSIP